MEKIIFLVEDNRDNSELVERILTHYGYSIKTFEKGQDALDYCKKNPPPVLIFMDISLPDIDGLQVTKEIKKIEAYKNIPIIATTAYASIEMQEKILEAGCINMLAKPFSPSELVKMLEQYNHPSN